MASWIPDVESKLFTLIKHKGEKELKEKYPNIYYTTDNESSTQTHYPTVYIHFLPNDERGQDLDGISINAFLCSLQLEVTVSKSQGQAVAKKVMWNAIESLKELGFNVFQMPEFIETGNDTKRMIARARRLFGSGDEIG